MNTIIKVALSTIFKNENIDNVLEVINGTPNPELATLILLGEYVQPVFCKVITDKNRVVKTLMSYDRWNDTIWYSYEEKKSIDIYYDADKWNIHPDIITKDNYKEYQCSYYKDCKSKTIILDEMIMRHGTCKSKDWPKVTVEESNMQA